MFQLILRKLIQELQYRSCTYRSCTIRTLNRDINGRAWESPSVSIHHSQSSVEPPGSGPKNAHVATRLFWSMPMLVSEEVRPGNVDWSVNRPISAHFQVWS